MHASSCPETSRQELTGLKLKPEINQKTTQAGYPMETITKPGLCGKDARCQWRRWDLPALATSQGIHD
jgi:hypothetical protein